MRTKAEQATKTVGPVDLNFIGGHIAINFINTLRNDKGIPLETLLTDKDVVIWMKRMGFHLPLLGAPLPEDELVRCARTLRTIAVRLIKQKKAAGKITVTTLNHFLAGSISHLSLRQTSGLVVSARMYSARTAEQFLAPVAEAIAELLAHENFDLVRQCEGAGCVLWFCDRARGRGRRFCAEATCGMRTRVAAFRTRQRQSK